MLTNPYEIVTIFNRIGENGELKGYDVILDSKRIDAFFDRYGLARTFLKNIEKFKAKIEEEKQRNCIDEETDAEKELIKYKEHLLTSRKRRERVYTSNGLETVTYEDGTGLIQQIKDKFEDLLFKEYEEKISGIRDPLMRERCKKVYQKELEDKLDDLDRKFRDYINMIQFEIEGSATSIMPYRNKNVGLSHRKTS